MSTEVVLRARRSNRDRQKRPWHCTLDDEVKHSTSEAARFEDLNDVIGKLQAFRNMNFALGFPAYPGHTLPKIAQLWHPKHIGNLPSQLQVPSQLESGDRLQRVRKKGLPQKE
ncbi:hypothetical protein HPB50_021520 [Hyalomma asiaticum]|uniref:Uncharacterized protein n=1 Tax=Hyalomma asiaticum TaxID=266040 RepID=A0ACB7SRU7_HYAAI|nr:hypothetical protein HPB50_021520 [Hyalomma asiaticum]